MTPYIFERGDMWYPIELTDDADARRGAEINKGTTKVTNAITGEVVWVSSKDMNAQVSDTTEA